MIRLNRSYIALLHDLAMAWLAYVVSLYLRIGTFNFNVRGPWVEQSLIFVAICAAAFTLTNLYRGIWRYVSVRELGTIVKAATIAVVAYVPICFALTRLEGVPRS